MTSLDRDESHEYSKELHFSRSDVGEVSFIVLKSSGFNDSSTFQALDRFFDEEYLKTRAYDISYHGGRGQTMFFTMPHEYIGTLYGPKQDLALLAARQHALHKDGHASVANTASTASAASSANGASGAIDTKVVAGSNLSAGEHPDSGSEGKEALPSYPLCLRQYRRGGFVGKFIKTSFCRFAPFAQRARLEFELTAQLFYEHKLPVPRPLIAREIMGTFTVENAIVVEQIPHTRNLAEILATGRTLTSDELKTIGNTLAHFFVTHVVHSDLNIRNILLNDEGKCFVIDFDKCYCCEKFGKNHVSKMLSRLERSFAKEKQLKGLSFLAVESLMKELCAAVRSA